MIRLHVPEQAPEDAPRERDTRAPRRGRNREIDELRARVEDLESDRDRLRGQLRRVRRGVRATAATRTEEPVPAVTEAANTAVQPPQSAAAASAMILEILELKRREATDQSVAPDIDARYKALSQGTFADATPEVSEELMKQLANLQQGEYQDHPERPALISATIQRLSPQVPKNAEAISALVSAIAPLKEQEARQRGYSAALDAQIMTAYRRLSVAIPDSTVTYSQVSRLLKDVRRLQSGEYRNTDGPRGAVYMARHALLDTSIAALETAEEAARGKSLWRFVPGYGPRNKAA